MSHWTIQQAAKDTQLQDRIQASAWREYVFDETKRESWFGKQMTAGGMTTPWSGLYWQVAVDTEAAYESALQAGRGAPGHDTDVITDAALTSAVVAHWPEDPNPPVTTVPEPLP